MEHIVAVSLEVYGIVLSFVFAKIDLKFLADCSIFIQEAKQFQTLIRGSSIRSKEHSSWQFMKRIPQIVKQNSRRLR